MTRRAIFGLLALPALAADRDEVVAVLMRLAAALSAGDPVEFFRHVDAGFPERSTFRAHVEALAARYELSCSVELTDLNGDEATADWFMELKGRAPGGPSERRRQTVRAVVRGKKLFSLTPLSLFD